MIDGALKYDPKFRPSYVYLNETAAHSLGTANNEVLARVLRTFKENDHIVAEVLPQRKYRGEKFEELAAEDGTHPGRSIDLWPKEYIPNCPSDYYLEGIALCGVTKPATVNLPAIYYSAETENGFITFALHTKPSHGDETMPEDPKDQKVDFAAVQKQLDEQNKKIEQLAADNKTLSAERDHYKTEHQNLAKEFAIVKSKQIKQEVEAIFATELAGKIVSEERDRRINFAVGYKERGDEEGFAEYIDSLKARQVMVDLKLVAGHLPNQTSGAAPQTPNQAINQFAAKHNIDTGTLEGLEKAEAGARQEFPAAFGIKEGVR